MDLNNLVEEALSLAYHGARAQDPCSATASMPPPSVIHCPSDNDAWASAFDDRGKAPSWNRFQQTAEHRILVVHAKHSFLSLFNQKDTTKPKVAVGVQPQFVDSFPGQPCSSMGIIEVDSEFGEFTEFTVRLPRSN